MSEIPKQDKKLDLTPEMAGKNEINATRTKDEDSVIVNINCPNIRTTEKSGDILHYFLSPATGRDKDGNCQHEKGKRKLLNCIKD